MRPTLTLKKPAAKSAEPVATITPVVAVQVEPIKPVESVKSVKKLPKQLPKDVKAARLAQTEANRILGEEQHKQKLAHLAKVKPFFDEFISSKAIFNETIIVDDVECFRPLMIGVRKVILDFIKSQPDFQDCTNTTINNLIEKKFKYHTERPRYINGLLKFNERFDLNGNPVGVISEKHKAKAQAKADLFLLKKSK